MTDNRKRPSEMSREEFWSGSNSGSSYSHTAPVTGKDYAKFAVAVVILLAVLVTLAVVAGFAVDGAVKG